MKKRFLTESILFLAAVVFSAACLWGDCFTQLRETAAARLRGGDPGASVSFREETERILTEELNFHDLLIDADSFRNFLLGTRVVKKDDSTVIRADSDSLCSSLGPAADEDVAYAAERILELETVSRRYGAEFLYCMAPRKEEYERLPENANNRAAENAAKFLAALEERGIPAVDLQDAFTGYGQTEGTEIFFYTDHHWRPRSGFLAAAAICSELSSRYGFPYDEEAADLGNYTVTVYPKWFLGSKGKKVGRLFTLHGLDDFELIVPAFETEMEEERPVSKKKRTGTFEETLLFMNNLKKDHYHKNTYATYSGGDHPEQIMRNLLKPEGKKILLIKDSFAWAVSPFLALQAGELHILDIRDMENLRKKEDAKPDLEACIRDLRPDCVLVLYNGFPGTEPFDFFAE